MEVQEKDISNYIWCNDLAHMFFDYGYHKSLHNAYMYIVNWTKVHKNPVKKYHFYGKHAFYDKQEVLNKLKAHKFPIDNGFLKNIEKYEFDISKITNRS